MLTVSAGIFFHLIKRKHEPELVAGVVLLTVLCDMILSIAITALTFEAAPELIAVLWSCR